MISEAGINQNTFHVRLIPSLSFVGGSQGRKGGRQFSKQQSSSPSVPDEYGKNPVDRLRNSVLQGRTDSRKTASVINRKASPKLRGMTFKLKRNSNRREKPV